MWVMALIPVNTLYPRSWLKAKERLASRQVIIVTDFDVHAMWLVHHYEHYFVAIDEARYPKLTRYVAGILSRPSFSRYVEREAAFLAKDPA